VRVTTTDPAYRARLGREQRYWTKLFSPGFHRVMFQGGEHIWNAALTGDAQRPWLADLVARGPFRDAAVLGCDDATPAAAWVAARGSDRLDVYDVTPEVMRVVRAELPRRHGVRFLRSDLNFVRLPPARYDVIWSSGCLHHVTNLEHLFGEVERALRPGGLFAFHDYVGERWRQYGDRRLARVNALLAEVPPRFRRAGIAEIRRPLPEEQSPFCAVRSDEILAIAAASFDVVHRGTAFALFPLFLYLDVAALEHEAPDLLARLLAAEEEARSDSRLPPCSAYAVFRRR
jgi:SAM-dependent methyltransferase